MKFNSPQYTCTLLLLYYKKDKLTYLVLKGVCLYF
jgi:hypothetical protein